MQTAVSIMYYLIVAAIAGIILMNLGKAKDPRKIILYAVVLMPFALRILRLK